MDYYDGATIPSTPPTSPEAAPVKGQVTATQEVDSYTGSTLASAHWVTSSSTAYDSMGRPTSQTDVLGHATTTAYSPSSGGPLQSETVTNPLGWTTTTAYDSAWGVETSATDQNGNVTTAAYDALGRRTDVWLPNRAQAANPSAPSISYAYGESQTTPSTVTTTTLTATTQNTEIDLYDGLGQEVQTQKTGVGGTVASDTGYDTAGRVDMTNSPYLTTQSAPSTSLFVPASEQQVPSETVTEYDGAGRTTATILNGNGVARSTTSYSYEGADEVDETPPAGGTPTSTFTNSLGEKTKLVQYLAATPSSSATQESTVYGYDGAGEMTSMMDPSGNAWTWTYSVLGQEVQSVDPDTGTTTSSYDAAGNLLSTTDARGVTLSYSYDALNRKTAEYQGPAGSGGSLLDSWVYDTVAKGQLTSSTSYVGSVPGTPGAAYTESTGGYNALNQPTSTTVSIPAGAPALAGTSYTTSYVYDQDGSAAQEDPAEGGLAAETIKSTYDANDDETALRGTSVYLSNVSYSGIGQPTGYNRTGGNAHDLTSYSYDQATGLVVGIGDSTLAGGVYTTTANRVYTRNADGQVTEAQNTMASASGPTTTDTQCYGYDYQDDLTAAWTPADNECTNAPSSANLGGPAPYWDSYTYDAGTGNRLSETIHATDASGSDETDSYAYPVAGSVDPHAVQTVTSTQGGSTTTSSFTHDADGDTTALPGETLTYDAEGKVASVTADGTTQSNIYDASGNLLVQSDPTNGTTLFLGDTELHVAVGASAASATRTYSADGVPVAERTTTAGGSASTLYWLSADVDGTVDMEIDASTGAVTHRFFDPFGNTRGN